MQRYAVITQVEIYSGEDLIGEVILEDGMGYKPKLNDTFMSKEDVCFVGKVMEFIEEHEDDLLIEEKIW